MNRSHLKCPFHPNDPGLGPKTRDWINIESTEDGFCCSEFITFIHPESTVPKSVPHYFMWCQDNKLTEERFYIDRFHVSSNCNSEHPGTSIQLAHIYTYKELAQSSPHFQSVVTDIWFEEILNLSEIFLFRDKSPEDILRKIKLYLTLQ